jgi:glycosyltransferase involved in cell wall biosynthesis
VFVGQKSGDELAAHYASADLFVFPSLTETFGNVTTEAMASGLPVAAFDYAAAAQWVRPGASGSLAPCGDERAFVQATLALAAAGPAGLRTMGQAAREAMAEADWEAVVARFESVLAGLQPPSFASSLTMPLTAQA